MIKKLLSILITLIPIASLGAEELPKLRIGVIFPFSGKEARQGSLGKIGINLALRELTDFQPEVIYEDSQSDTSKAVIAFHKLSSVNHVDAVLTMGSPTAMALLPLANRTHTPLLAMAVTSNFSSPNDYGFRLMGTASGFGAKIIELLEKDLKKKRIALVYVENDYGGAYERYFKESLGKELIASEAYLPGINDFRSILLKLKTVKPDAIILASWGMDAGILLHQAKEIGLVTPVFICPGACDNPDVAVSGAGATDPLVIVASASKTTSERAKLLSDEFKESPTSVVLRFFDALTLLRYANERCRTDTIIDRVCIQKSLSEARSIPGSSYPISIDANGDIVDSYDLKVVRGMSLVHAQVKELNIIAE